MQLQTDPRPPLRLPPLPHPNRPRERRHNRPTDTSSALIAAFDHAVQRGGLDVILLVDEFGMLVSKSSTDLDLAQLAAVTPIVGRGVADAAIRRGGAARGLSVQPVEILGEVLYVAALGGARVAREREVKKSLEAADRILNS